MRFPIPSCIAVAATLFVAGCGQEVQAGGQESVATEQPGMDEALAEPAVADAPPVLIDDVWQNPFGLDSVAISDVSRYPFVVTPPKSLGVPVGTFASSGGKALAFSYRTADYGDFIIYQEPDNGLVDIDAVKDGRNPIDENSPLYSKTQVGNTTALIEETSEALTLYIVDGTTLIRIFGVSKNFTPDQAAAVAAALVSA
jgi:hypothetical protein